MQGMADFALLPTGPNSPRGGPRHRGRLARRIGEAGRAGLVLRRPDPAAVYELLGRGQLDWSKVSVNLSDERQTTRGSPDSNARLVRDTLLKGRSADASFVDLVARTD